MNIFGRRALTSIAAHSVRRRQLYPSCLQKARRREPKLVFPRLRIWLLGEPGVLPGPDDITHKAGHSNMPKAGFYAVRAGLKPGIYETWAECEAQVKGYPAAAYKKFKSQQEAEAFMQLKSDAKPYARPGNGDRNHVTSITETEQATSAPTKRELSPELVKIAEEGFTITPTKPHHLVVYTDGSSRGNGKTDAKAGLGVWWSGRRPALKSNVSERLPGQLQTNNRGELLAIIRALETCPFPDLPLEIRTDSKYSISCMTVYLPSWIRNDFKTSGMHSEPIKNQDLIMHLLALLHDRGPTNGVKFKHVAAHRGEAGNEGADRLANQGALSPPVPDRTDWRVPENYRNDSPAAAEPPVDVEIEVDESWLMTPEELAALEKGL